MKLFAFVQDLFLKVFRVLKPILKAVFTSAFQYLMAELKDVAVESIKKAAATDLSNDDKRAQVVKEVKEYAIQKCLTFDNTDIYTIVQLLYKNLKVQGVIE